MLPWRYVPADAEQNTEGTVSNITALNKSKNGEKKFKMEGEDTRKIIVMDAGTDTIKLLELNGQKQKQLKVPAVLARKKHNRKIQSETKFGMEAYKWERAKTMKNRKEEENEEKAKEKKEKEENNEDEEDIELVYPHIRHPLNYKKNAIYIHKQNLHDQKLLWNYALQRIIEKEKITGTASQAPNMSMNAVGIKNKCEIKEKFKKQNAIDNINSLQGDNNIADTSTLQNKNNSHMYKSILDRNDLPEYEYTNLHNDDNMMSICIAEPPPFLCTKNYRREIFSWIFESNKFSSAAIIQDCLAAAIFFRLHSALVVDVGELYSRCVCILENEIDSHTYRHIPLAAHSATSYLERIVGCRYADEYVDRFLIQDIKKKSCFVSASFQKDLWVNNRCRGLHTYKLPGGVHIDLGADAFLCNEAIFNPAVVLGDFEHQSLPSIIVESIHSSSIDYRKTLMQNIILTGAATSTFNFTSRLEQEIESAWRSSFTCGALHVSVQQHPDAILLGAAKYASENKDDKDVWLCRNEYEENGCERFLHKTEGRSFR